MFMQQFVTLSTINVGASDNLNSEVLLESRKKERKTLI